MVTLFCFHGAGGSSTMFTRLANLIDRRRVEIYAVDLPGRGRRFAEPLCRDIRAAVERTCDVVLSRLNGAPYAFLGHSLGSLVSYELAREIAARKMPAPSHLFLASHGAPDAEAKACFTPEKLSRFLRDHNLTRDALAKQVQSYEAGGKICFAIDEIEKIRDTHAEIHWALLCKARLPHDLPEEQLFAAILDLGGTPREVFESQELKSLLLPIMRADFEISENYRFVPRPDLLNSDFTILSGKDDESVNREDIEGWRRHTLGRCNVIEYEAGHFIINDHAERIAEIINAESARIV